MKIEDLLSVAGESPLKMYVWGEGVVEVINAMLPADRRMTQEVSGKDANALLRSLPGPALMQLLMIELDPLTGRPVVKTAPGAEATPAAVIAVPVATPEMTKNPRQMVALVAGLGMVLIALMLAFAVTKTAVDKGEAPDAKTIQGLVQILGEVVKAYSEPAAPAQKAVPATAPPSSAPETPPAPEPAPPHTVPNSVELQEAPGHPP